MRYINVLSIGVGVSLLMLIACSGDSGTDGMPTSLFTISGSVREVGRAAGVPGVRLSLAPDREAVTDGAGRYRFSDLLAGEYVVQAALEDRYIFPVGTGRSGHLEGDLTIDFEAVVIEDGEEAMAISVIQGSGHVSPFVDETVKVVGVVSAIRGEGFSLQSLDPDDDNATSEGLSVFLGVEHDRQVGDIVGVTGGVVEFVFAGYSATDLTVTQIAGDPLVEVLASGYRLQDPVVIGVDGRLPPTSRISDGAISGVFDPGTEGIDFWESLEDMRVQVDDPQVIGGGIGSGGDRLFGVVGNNGRQATILTDRGGLLLSEGDDNPEIITVVSDGSAPSEIKTGDKFDGPIVGIVGYERSRPKLFATDLSGLVPGRLIRETSSLEGEETILSVATFNVKNLSGVSDVAKIGDLASTIVDGLNAPDIVGLQEIQDNSGPSDDGIVGAEQTYGMLIDAIADQGGPTYRFRQIDPEDNRDGGEPGGNIRVGFLYNPARISFVDRGAPSVVVATTVDGTVDLSISPGRILDGGAFEDSRKPLVGQFRFEGEDLFVVVAHLNSKGGDGPAWGIEQPPNRASEAQRVRQAQAIHDFAASLLGIDSTAHLLVLGDLNDLPWSDALTTLKGSLLENLAERVPNRDRYSFQFDGNSQLLDHLLASSAMVEKFQAIDIAHRYADYDAGSRHGDHDPIVATFLFPESVDMVSPTWLADPALEGAATYTGATIGFTVDEDATLFWAAYPADAAAPTADAIREGAGASLYGSESIAGSIPATLTVAGLGSTTEYDLYFVATDASNNDSTVGMLTLTTAALAIFFSDYGEGGSDNKYVEIYNGTGADLPLIGGDTPNFYLLLLLNPTPEKSFQDNGRRILFDDGATIADGDVYGIHHTSANASIKENGDQASGSLRFNGDDAIALVQETNGNDSYQEGIDIILDLIGDPDADADFAKDVGLMRMATIAVGSATYDASQWEEYSKEDVDLATNYGSHSGP